MPGILGSIYRTLDPVLPFDRYLDPRFGILGGGQEAPTGGILGARRAMAPMPTQAAYAPPQAPELAGAPRRVGGIDMSMGFGPVPQLQPQAQPSQGGGERPWKPSALDVLWGVAAGNSPGQARRGLTIQHEEDMARQSAGRTAAEEDAIARRVFANDERGYLAWRANREKAGEALSSGLEDYTLSPGAQRGRGGQIVARAPFAPLSGGPGTQFRDPSTGALIGEVPYKPEVVSAPTTNNVTIVDPNSPGGALANPRSPEVGQYIQGRLQGVPGLRLGSAAPRSEAEIASLPLSAPDTYHRQGAALDFTAPGQKPEEVIAAVRGRMGAGYDVIYHPENGSYHVEPGPGWQPPGGQGGGTRVVQQGAPKAAAIRPMTDAERQQWGIPVGIPASLNTETGQPQILSGAASALPKPPPRLVVSGYGANRAALAQIDRAMALIREYPGSVGLIRGVGEAVNQRADPQGVSARAALADISGQIMSDRSGASVPASEMKRLQPYLPQVTDRSDTAIKKLQGLRQQLELTNQQMQYDYPGLGEPGAGLAGGNDVAGQIADGEVPTEQTAPPARRPERPQQRPVQVRSIREAEALPKGTVFVLNGRRGVVE